MYLTPVFAYLSLQTPLSSYLEGGSLTFVSESLGTVLTSLVKLDYTKGMDNNLLIMDRNLAFLWVTLVYSLDEREREREVY